MSATVVHEADEETPLFQPQSKKPLFPWFQFTIVFLLEVAEALPSNVIRPFVPQLIRDLGITNGNESKVGYYVGIMQSLFFLTQAFTILHWNRLSDHVGRRPVLLIGLSGLSLSLFCIGLSKTFVGLVFSRALNGALNGNIGIIKSTMAEITDPTNIAQGYANIQIARCISVIIGPLIGGSLSQPAKRFPSPFGKNEFLKKYPYFLACAIPVTLTACVWLMTYISLKETVKQPVSFGDLLKSKIQQKHNQKAPTNSTVLQNPLGEEDVEKPLPIRELLKSRTVVVAGANYASLALLDIAFTTLQPVFFSTPVEFGGLGLPPPAIGKILSAAGVITGFAQVFLFAQVYARWGSKKILVCGITGALLLFISFPLINYLARTQGFSPLLWFAVGCHVVLSVLPTLAYGAVFIFITASAPNRASLGATNGLCQVAVSAMRAIGPAAATSLFSFSIEHKILGGFFVYYILVLIVGVSFPVASLLPSAV